jgi:formate dehydrogenase major subunit
MKKVVTVCPYCASGCKIHLVVDNGKIVRAEAAQGKTNQGTLCLKGTTAGILLTIPKSLPRA